MPPATPPTTTIFMGFLTWGVPGSGAGSTVGTVGAAPGPVSELYPWGYLFQLRRRAGTTAPGPRPCGLLHHLHRPGTLPHPGRGSRRHRPGQAAEALPLPRLSGASAGVARVCPHGRGPGAVVPARRLSRNRYPQGYSSDTGPGAAPTVPTGLPAPDPGTPHVRNPMKIVVVGGVAGGMSAAARARRLSEDAEIVVLERGGYVSFANCGLPYHVGDEIPQRSALLVQTPDSLRAALDLDVRIGHDVVAIDRENRTVTARHTTATGPEDVVLPYHALVLAPGAATIRPPIPGLDLPQVHTLRTVPDADGLRAVVGAGARRAIVLGAGFIGIETAEALRIRGLQVDLVDLAQLLDDELRANGVRTHVGVAAESITTSPAQVDGEHHGLDDRATAEVHLSDGSVLEGDGVVLSVGGRPDSRLAADAGLELGPQGAIVVDSEQRTSDPHIWAVGDATAVRHAVTGLVGPVPLA